MASPDQPHHLPPLSWQESDAPVLAMRPVELGADAGLLLAYARDLFAISFGDGVFAERYGQDGAGYLAWLADKQTIDPANAALTLLDGVPVGMVVIGPWALDGTVGYVFHYYLRPGNRGRGLAPALDAYARDRLRLQGFSEARLSVAEANQRAIRFYRKQGWSRIGPRPDQPGILYMGSDL